MKLLIPLMTVVAAIILGPADAIDQCVYVCPAHWHHFQQSCYRYFSDRVTWQQALGRCKGVEADLVSIHSRSENTFAYDLILAAECISPTTEDNFAWIGYYQTTPGSAGNFVWSDGSSANFESWAPEQPDNYGRVEDCGHFRGDPAGSWNDFPCNNRIGYICKKEPTYFDAL